MAITGEEIAREKKRVPRGWGRFGKSLERLAEVSEPDEALLSSCVGLNPTFHHRARGPVIPDVVPVGMIAGTIDEMMQTTNVVLAVTSERLIVIGTGMGGAARDVAAIPLHGMEVASREKRELVLRWPGGEMRIRGAGKKQLPGFLETVEAQARSAGARAQPQAFARLARPASSRKPAWSQSFAAEAASTLVTTRPAGGFVRRSATMPSALHAPTQRVQVTSSPTARWILRPRGRRLPSSCSTNGSRTQVPIFSRAITFDNANVAAEIGTSSRPEIGSSRIARSRVAITSAPSRPAQIAFSAA
jgi:hypothetical protein